ncbi:MAG: DUF2271 domain-containing protein [Acidimicrobiales bacterium]
MPGLACGNSDADVIAAATTVTTDGSSTTRSSVSPADTSQSSETQTSEAQAAEAPPTGSALAASAELQIDFTFSAEGGRIQNPYVAVWVEDAAGNLVDTVGVWYQQGPKGQKWVRRPARWYTAADSGQNGAELSSATRSPGDYSLLWDATSADGNKVAAGEYCLH